MSDYVLRPFLRRDLDQVIDIENASFPDSPYTSLEFLWLRDQSGDGFLVADEGGRVLGYVIVMEVGGDGVIQSIAVSPQSRRRGIADSLMMAAFEALKDSERIRLLVDSNNDAAISLYHKHTFKETGRIFRKYYRNGNDAIEMMKG
jgi:[ribosomal protein S18]-alanine N-acetyltransferase